MKGSMEPLPFRLNISELARIAGCNRQWLSEAFSTLVMCRLFSTYKENLYLINKDYRLWLTPDGKPRLTDAQVAWCREVVRDWVESDEQVEIDVAPMSGNPDSVLSSLSGKPDSVSGNPDSEHVSPVGKTRHNCRENPTLGVPPIPPSPERREDNHNGIVVVDDINSSNHKTITPPLRSSRPIEVTPEQVAQLVGWARVTLGERCELESFDCKIAPYTRSYPIAWIEEAILAAKVGADPGGLDRYVNKVLVNMHKAGGPASPPQRNGVPPGPALPPPAAPAAPGFRINPPKRKKDS
jgi:hypothetical protein